MRVEITFLMVLCSILVDFGFGQSQDGSKCQGVSCSPPTPGAQCEAKYGSNDPCCPVWHCTQNGYTSTIYGRMSSGGSSQSSFYSSSTGGGNPGNVFSTQTQTQNGGGFGGGFPNLGMGGFQFQMPNLGNLFG